MLILTPPIAAKNNPLGSNFKFSVCIGANLKLNLDINCANAVLDCTTDRRIPGKKIKNMFTVRKKIIIQNAIRKHLLICIVFVLNNEII